MIVTWSELKPFTTLRVGDRVVRGPHWIYRGQDCLNLSERNPQTAGTVQEVDRAYPLNVKVLWDSGHANTYRYDMERQEVIPLKTTTEQSLSTIDTLSSGTLEEPQDLLLNESRESLRRRLLDL